MTLDYRQFGLRTACDRFAHESDPHSASPFDHQMRALEAGVAALNLTPDAVHLAAEVAALEAQLDDRERIALIALILVSVAALEEGSTRFPVTGPDAAGPLRRMLTPLCGEAFGPSSVAEVARAIEDLLASGKAGSVIGTNDEFKPLLYLAPFIYHHRVRAAETALAGKLAMLLKTEDKADDRRIRSMLADVARRPALIQGKPMMLSDEQLAAVELAARARLTVITGGPGTGKTSIVLAILRLLVRLGVDPGAIALSAPTGKAAYRIGESVRDGVAQINDPAPADQALAKKPPQPATIHRLLGYSHTLRRFRHHQNNRLSESVVIVDEGSMLDLHLMQRLLIALSAGARLIIMGDADQLPSVAAGAVFRDLLPDPAAAVPEALRRSCVRLTRSYRTEARDPAGAAILTLAGAINSGDDSGFQSASGDSARVARRTSAEQLKFSATEWLDDPSGRYGALLDRWYGERVRGDSAIDELAQRTYVALDAGGFDADECGRLRALFSHGASARILCVTRVLDSGAERINARLHRRAAAAAGASPEQPLLAGEPVIVLRNDYERGLFNGDQGLVLRVRRPGSAAALMAVFPRNDNFVSFSVDALRDDFDLCYAMTVHKAQGSEFDSVAVIMPAEDIPLLSREIFYTAVSRARKSVTIVGSGEIIRAAISRPMVRYCGLREQLASMLA
jgi:exodeoxyribonuclease V alpha subunit